MILVTGGTGFIGQSLVRRLVEEGHDVRVLIRASNRSPSLPPGIPVQAAFSSLSDERGLRAALVGVDVVYHLAGVNWLDSQPDLHQTEVVGTRNLLEAAQDAGVDRLLFLSQIGADRAAAYPSLKVKGIAEERIRQSSIPYTIFRSALVFGPGDNFTVPLVKLLALSPGFFLLPGDGNTLVQPLWVEDLVSCLVWALDDQESANALIELGGPEHLTFSDVVKEVMEAADIQRSLFPVQSSYLRLLISTLRFFFSRLPISNLWLDYLASSRVTELETVPRIFGLLPARYSHRLDYLRGVNWRKHMLAEMFTRSS